jgi:uridine kinase
MKSDTKPLFVGIAGGSGSGKSTIAQKMAAGLPACSVATLVHDAYYKNRREMPFEQRKMLNYDHPDAHDNDLLVDHLDALSRGISCDIPIYDFVSHNRCDKTRRVVTAPVVILEGILVFAEPRLRDRLDVKIFVDTDADIRLLRRIRRDLEERGRSFDEVCEQYYRTVRPMHLQFVEPSKRWADLIIPEGGNNHVALDLVLGKLQQVVRARRPDIIAPPPKSSLRHNTPPAPLH